MLACRHRLGRIWPGATTVLPTIPTRWRTPPVSGAPPPGPPVRRNGLQLAGVGFNGPKQLAIAGPLRDCGGKRAQSFCGASNGILGRFSAKRFCIACASNQVRPAPSAVRVLAPVGLRAEPALCTHRCRRNRPSCTRPTCRCRPFPRKRPSRCTCRPWCRPRRRCNGSRRRGSRRRGPR
jgi:hypothetical protein